MSEDTRTPIQRELAVRRARLGILTRNVSRGFGSEEDIAVARQAYVGLGLQHLVEQAMEAGHLTEGARYRIGMALELPLPIKPAEGETWRTKRGATFVIEHITDDGQVTVKYTSARGRTKVVSEGDFAVGKFEPVV